MRRSALSLFGFSSWLLTACSSSPLSPGELLTLRQAETRWAARSFQAYSYETRTSCGECPHVIREWARVTVGDGSITGVVLVANDSTLPVQDWISFTTVDGLFARIRTYQHADWVRDVIIEFDPQLGYPVRIDVFANPGIMDAGGAQFTRHVAPIP